jgi:hypothetical protein
MTLAAGCATGAGGRHDRRVGPPKVDRCATQKARKACEAARFAAVEFSRRLSVDDQVCIDGRMRLDEPMRACKVRAFVESTAPNGVKLEIREAPMSAIYTQGSEWWFSEEALAEIQLRVLGYHLDSDDAPEPGSSP